MDLYQKISNDMKAALKEGNAIRLSVLRMALSSIRMIEIEKNLKTVSDADVLQIIQKQIKQRKDSIEQFKKGNRQDLADKESEELKILETYMPAQLTQDELLPIIKEAIAQAGAVSKSDSGKVMKLVMEKVKGKSDGKTVSELVMKLLK